jgi:hypothetical protein
VYTPPENRRRGYAAACVYGISKYCTEAGYRCVLYTDLGNPTSNAIYRRIGYRAVAEAIHYRFEAGLVFDAIFKHVDNPPDTPVDENADGPEDYFRVARHSGMIPKDPTDRIAALNRIRHGDASSEQLEL